VKSICWLIQLRHLCGDELLSKKHKYYNQWFKWNYTVQGVPKDNCYHCQQTSNKTWIFANDKTVVYLEVCSVISFDACYVNISYATFRDFQVPLYFKLLYFDKYKHSKFWLKKWKLQVAEKLLYDGSQQNPHLAINFITEWKFNSAKD